METAKQPKTMYDASAGEIAFKNFLAGFSRGLGGFLITILTWIALYYFSIHYVLPQIAPYFSEAKNMIQSAQELQRGATNLMSPPGNSKTTTPGSEAGTPGFVVTPDMIRQVQQMQNK